MTATHMFGVVDDDIEVVTFLWSNKYGHCYECGAPAAYVRAYNNAHMISVEECEADMRRLTNGERGCSNPDEHAIKPENLLCSVCAAQAAAVGESIRWLFEQDFEEGGTDARH